ncbi:MAG: MtnX-like HAD-IB family phosphatase [Candidatus Omnitrophica bacterium]|nr:MtnX-like HAD-IB family phosphatase [Candidatus Omnitrophota bacterium]
MFKFSEIEAVFFDFDNTIARVDVLDEIIQRFSINDDWQKLEEAWARGEIGSRLCLEQQLSGVRITQEKLVEYLKTVEIDPQFKPLLKRLRNGGLQPVITSDNVSFIIREILGHQGISDIPIFSNELLVHGDRWALSFPYFKADCPKCGNCKKSHLPASGVRKGLTVYVGDGRSDICPAEYSDIVFAKATLLKHLNSIKKECIPFEDLGSIAQYFK